MTLEAATNGPGGGLTLMVFDGQEGRSPRHPLLSYIPFKDEPVGSICPVSDVIEFAEYYAIYFGEDEVAIFLSYVRDSGILEATERASVYCSREFPEELVGSLKHSFAYTRVLSGMASVDAVNALGLPYLFESDNDLDGAFLLAARGRYKQANQLLRSALEAAVTHAYFSAIGLDFDCLGAIRSPSVRGRRGGMLDRLVVMDIVSSEEAESMSSLYGGLSTAVHSHQRHFDAPYYEPESTTRDCEEFAAMRLVDFLRSARDVSIAATTIMLNMAWIESGWPRRWSPGEVDLRN